MMKERYFLYEAQTGQGCDYTIGCGSRLTEIKASSLEEVLNKLVPPFTSLDDDEYYEDEYLRTDASRRATAQVLVCHDVVDLIPLLNAKSAEHSKAHKAKEKADADEAERLKYEELKAKFES